MLRWNFFGRCASSVALLVLYSSAAGAAPGPGSGVRSVPTPSAKQAPAAPTPAKAAAAPLDHKRGKAPPQPAATLPPGAAKQAQDGTARRQIAGGPTADDLRASASDPELSALRAADRVLFPRALVGFRPGWSWGPADPSVQADGLPPAAEALPSAKVPAATNAEWLRSLALPDFPVKLDPLVVEYLRFYRDTTEGRGIAQVWARKVGRYTAAMQEELARAGLPRDLVWLSLIESGHSPTIVSPAGAAGMWQFIPDSARLYGLTVDRWVDERLDPLRSTQAATRFLSDLYQRFGSWELAMAAYNMGHAGLLKTLRKYNTNDYWKLSEYEAGLPWETTLYVPKVFAIAIVMNNRRAFGLHEIEPDPAITFDTVYVNSAMLLADVARASGIPVSSLRSMNPQYPTDRVPPVGNAGKADKSAQRWPVRVPRGMGAKTARALVQTEVRSNYDVYTVRFGDTLETIAAQVQLSVEQLAELNVLLPTEGLIAGAVLLVPKRAAAAAPVTAALESVVVPEPKLQLPGRKRVFYRVVKGDTLAAVANALDVTQDELIVWNELDSKAKIQAGMTLQAFVTNDTDLSKVRVLSAKQAQVLQVGSVDFLTHFENLNGRKRLLVKARKGDTLEAIGKRHGLSVGMMERINRCSRTRVLKPGEQLVVYAKSSPDASAPQAAAAGTVVGKPLATQVQAPNPELLPR